MPDGYGEEHKVDGAIYKGYWKDGTEHGQGMIIQPDGTKKEGEWINGVYFG